MLLADMDSTILQIETLDEIGHAIGKAREIAEITEKAMNGDIDFETALRNRVKLLAGLNINQLIEFALEKLVDNSRRQHISENNESQWSDHGLGIRWFHSNHGNRSEKA